MNYKSNSEGSQDATFGRCSDASCYLPSYIAFVRSVFKQTQGKSVLLSNIPFVIVVGSEVTHICSVHLMSTSRLHGSTKVNHIMQNPWPIRTPIKHITIYSKY